jgi:hypothetical protein
VVEKIEDGLDEGVQGGGVNGGGDFGEGGGGPAHRRGVAGLGNGGLRLSGEAFGEGIAEGAEDLWEVG